jgi:hypothetical protein
LNGLSQDYVGFHIGRGDRVVVAERTALCERRLTVLAKVLSTAGESGSIMSKAIANSTAQFDRDLIESEGFGDGGFALGELDAGRHG